MDSPAHQGIWGDEFHFLPFVSIMGASTIGAVNASMAMARDGMPGSVGIIFLMAWGLVTCMLLVAGNQLFCRKQLAKKLNRTVIARTGSGAAFVLVTLFAVYGTYSAVSSVSGAQARSVIAVPEVQSTLPVTASIQAEPAPQTGGAGSIHYQTSGQTYQPSGALPAPIAPPIGELARLPKPATLQDSDLNATGGQDPNASALEIKPSAQTPERKAIKKRPAKRKSKQTKPKSIIAKPAKPVTFSTVDSASAPAPARQLQGEASQRNGSNFSAKSIGCTGRNCGEADDNR
ncbi:MAG: hypothetical protein AAGI06_14380 [Pseudomonadota bacterium]